MTGKIAVCLYSHNHGTDAYVEIVPQEMNSSTVEQLLTLALIEEFGQGEVEKDTQDYGGIDYHHSIEPGHIKGIDGEWYKLSIKKLDIEQLAPCKFCAKMGPLETAHRHDGGYVGECCWEERFKITE